MLTSGDDDGGEGARLRFKPATVQIYPDDLRGGDGAAAAWDGNDGLEGGGEESTEGNEHRIHQLKWLNLLVQVHSRITQLSWRPFVSSCTVSKASFQTGSREK